MSDDAMSEALSNATIKVKAEMGESSETINKESGVTADPLITAFFRVGTENLNKQAVEKMDTILEYAKKEADSEDNIDVMRALKDIRFRLGNNPMDVSFLDHFYQYVKLRLQARNLEAEIKAMEE